jgi:hypothetical protein
MSRQFVALSPGVSMDASLADTLPAPALTEAAPICIVGECLRGAEEVGGLVDYCAEHANEWLTAESGAA